jgi:hypothetical protein
MPRDGAIIFCDLVGKLDVLNVECEKCGRRGRYGLSRLIARYGIDAKLFEWSPEADCPRKVVRNEHDPCGARCPDLSKGGVSPPVDLLGIKATQLYAPQARTSSGSQGRGQRHRTDPLWRIEPEGVWPSLQNTS